MCTKMAPTSNGVSRRPPRTNVAAAARMQRVAILPESTSNRQCSMPAQVWRHRLRERSHPGSALSCPDHLTDGTVRARLHSTGAPRRSARVRRRRGFVQMPLQRPLLALLLSASILGACAQAEPTPVPTAQASPTPTSAPLPPSTPTPAQTPTLVVTCTDAAGRVLESETEIPGDDRPLTYWLYLPPCFDASASHPTPPSTCYTDWHNPILNGLTSGSPKSADQLIARGSIPAVIIVMPGERTGFDMLGAVTDVLLPEIEGSLPTGGLPELRAIGGLSRGAGWALRIGMQHPDLFGAIGLHSPAVISPDLYSLSTWAAEVPSASVPRRVGGYRSRGHSPARRPSTSRAAWTSCAGPTPGPSAAASTRPPTGPPISSSICAGMPRPGHRTARRGSRLDRDSVSAALGCGICASHDALRRRPHPTRPFRCGHSRSSPSPSGDFTRLECLPSRSPFQAGFCSRLPEPRHPRRDADHDPTQSAHRTWCRRGSAAGDPARPVRAPAHQSTRDRRARMAGSSGPRPGGPRLLRLPLQ